jgi:hypothetical protein
MACFVVVIAMIWVLQYKIDYRYSGLYNKICFCIVQIACALLDLKKRSFTVRTFAHESTEVLYLGSAINVSWLLLVGSKN